MPTSRPWNLPTIIKCYLQDMEPHPFEIRWHLMCQGPEPDPKGFYKSSEGIGCAPDGWLWFPSDDSIQPSTLFWRLGKIIQSCNGIGAVVFSQRRRGVCPWTGGSWDNEEPGILRADPANMKKCRVDCTQVFFERMFLNGFRFQPAKHGSECDGGMIEELFERDPSRFVFAPNDYVFFNSLDP